MPRQAANAILHNYWDRKLPVDPIAIAKKMGVQVSAVFGGPVSGEFCIEGGVPTIKYNVTEPPVRQRFTVAHEIGHYALSHGSAFRDPSAHFSANSYEPKEVEANQFAAELLMPKPEVDRLIQNGNTSLSALALFFGVSEVAMKFRLKNLGWIS